MKKETKYTIILVLEGLLLSFCLMGIFNIKMLPPPDKVFAEVFDVNVRIEFEMVYNDVGGLPVDWERLYEGSISSDKILPYISDWKTEIPQAYRSSNSKQFFEVITNGLFIVSDRDPFHPGGRYYLAAYDIDKEKLLLWDSKR